MISITEVPAYCICGWQGVVGECDADDEGDQLCPECARFAVIVEPQQGQPTLANKGE